MGAVVTVQFDQAWTERITPALNAALFSGARVGAEVARGLLGRDHGGIPSIPGNPPNSQSGHLSRSISAASPEDLGTPRRAAFGTNVVYGKYLEFGATPVAKGGALVIPINRAARRLLVEAGGRARSALLAMRFRYHYGNTHVARIKTKKGGLLICVQADGGRGKGARTLLNEPMFVLAKSAHIAPRPWLRPAANRGRSAIVARVQKVFAIEAKKAGQIK